jgi:hypothetical protein
VRQRAEFIYGKTGGCTVGRNWWLATHSTWPFAGLYVYAEELILSTFLSRYRFPRGEISQIVRYYSGLSYGLKIEHTVADYPRFVVFWPWDIEEFEKILDANAFPVATVSV